jgi:hypothetical protein
LGFIRLLGLKLSMRVTRISVLAEFMVDGAEAEAQHACDVISVVAEFTVDGAGADALKCV